MTWTLPRQDPAAPHDATRSGRGAGTRTPHAAAEDAARALIGLTEVSKTYESAAGTFTALDGVDVAIGRGEWVSIVGKSGSGKSTLVNMIAGIDRPTSGEVWVAGTAVHLLSENALAIWRGGHIGIVFQFFQLLPTLTVLENVVLPMDFAGLMAPAERVSRARELLDRVDMLDHADKLPSAVSGGQQQRVAIARALANDPAIILADEPTGNLDSRTADAIFQLFDELVGAGKTVVLVTHDNELAARAHRTIALADGRIVEEVHHRSPLPRGRVERVVTA
jgi:putative ABC transport system ATP-binding protein